MEEPPSKKRDARRKVRRNHCDCESPGSAHTKENDNVAARQHLHNGLLLHLATPIVNGLIRLGIESIMVVRDETTCHILT